MTIAFPNIEAFDGSRDVVTFPAIVNNQQIICAISSEALCDNFGGKYGAAIETFQVNRPRIEAQAERLIKQRRYEVDGSIFIYTQDRT